MLGGEAAVGIVVDLPRLQIYAPFAWSRDMRGERKNNPQSARIVLKESPLTHFLGNLDLLGCRLNSRHCLLTQPFSRRTPLPIRVVTCLRIISTHRTRTNRCSRNCYVPCLCQLRVKDCIPVTIPQSCPENPLPHLCIIILLTPKAHPFIVSCCPSAGDR